MKFTVYKSLPGGSFKKVEMKIDEADYETREIGFFPDDSFSQLLARNRTQRELGLVFDMDQVYAAHGAVSEEQRQRVRDAIEILPPRPDMHLSGEDPDEQQRPMKAYAWVHDEIVIDNDKTYPEHMKACSEAMRERLHKLVGKDAEFFVNECQVKLAGVDDVDFVLCDYPDSRSFPSEEDQSRLEEAWERLREAVQKPQRIAITGCPSGAGIRGLMEKLCDDKDYRVVVDFSDVVMGDAWKAICPSEAELKIFKPNREWDQPKLRRGKGHNKFKRKGKK